MQEFSSVIRRSIDRVIQGADCNTHLTSMVCFECGRCNETIKKPKLAQHLERCGSASVTCIDCNTTFGWDGWLGHTSCVSEAQKYQGNLYQAKEKENKGQVKQESWTDNVQLKINDPSSNIAPQIKVLLERLLGFSNIPRKQKPFGNFVKNSLKIWNDKQISDMWDVIALANAKPPAAAGANGAAAGAAADKKWAGWKRALDDELESASDQVPWKRLCDAVVKRCQECKQTDGAGVEELGLQALASIPDNYLSKEDEYVRLPGKK